eukprot:8642348-Pyramimonas_sp.AAC.1
MDQGTRHWQHRTQGEMVSRANPLPHFTISRSAPSTLGRPQTRSPDRRRGGPFGRPRAREK